MNKTKKTVTDNTTDGLLLMFKFLAKYLNCAIYTIFAVFFVIFAVFNGFYSVQKTMVTNQATKFGDPKYGDT